MSSHHLSTLRPPGFHPTHSHRSLSGLRSGQVNKLLLTAGGAGEDAERVALVHGPHVEAAWHEVGEHDVEVLFAEARLEVVELDDVRRQGGVRGRLVVWLGRVRLTRSTTPITTNGSSSATATAAARLPLLGGTARCLRTRSGQVRSGQVRSGQVRSGQVRSGQVRAEQNSRFESPRRPDRNFGRVVVDVWADGWGTWKVRA